MERRGWVLVLVAASVLALVALASNATTTSQLEGRANALLAVRRTISQLLSAGTVWAGLSVVSGWLVRRPVQTFAAGVLALLLALVVHYGVGLILGMFDPNVWTENPEWFTAAVVLGGPLGVLGAITRRPDPWGVGARLVIPVGALLEPIVIGTFTSPAIMPWPTRFASISVGVALLAGGSVGCIKVLAAAKKQQSSTRGQRVIADTSAWLIGQVQTATTPSSVTSQESPTCSSRPTTPQSEPGHRVRYFTAADFAETLYRSLAHNSVGTTIDTLLRKRTGPA